MKPESNSRRLFGITRSKGKMYEFGLPEAMHIAVPKGSMPQELFLLTIGTLGDVAETINDAEDANSPLPANLVDELNFSASFFDAFLESKFSESLAHDTSLLSSAAYYLARRPGSSLVIARRLEANVYDSPVDKLLYWVLQAKWRDSPANYHPVYRDGLTRIGRLLALHFQNGSGLGELSAALLELRQGAYTSGSARDLLLIDIIAAIMRLRLANSAWTTLPGFTGISLARWAPFIRRPDFPKELWPSQMLLGQAGIFSGTSGVIQMPTSAGKTRSVEIVLRSSFLSGRNRLAIVVAPFRALCHEIGTSLRRAFRGGGVKVNELSDAMQLDFLQDVDELLGPQTPRSNYVLVLTPEKLLYVLRQAPDILKDIGLVVYDEGDQFDSGIRGITYELLLTEIKALLPPTAQTVLVSAVIQNAPAIALWLMRTGARVVNGSGLLPTTRSVAFASWRERLGQLYFFESNNYGKSDYFVPRILDPQQLTKRKGERSERIFPKKDTSTDIALYLGFRLASHGAVAVFCGRKVTASGMAARTVDVYERDFKLPPPATSANLDEVRRIRNLINRHFGPDSILSKSASLGVFVHHGTTPNGIRLSIEHAMQRGWINFVVCTSTLAQGVNLPIRYLIVSGIHQGAEKIKVRDFQNLIGRAGRSGMYTEGLIIFSDPEAFDDRRAAPWKFNSAVELLSPERTEDSTSSLLGLLGPLRTSDGKGVLQLSATDICTLVLADEQTWMPWAERLVRQNPRFKIDAKAWVTELRNRRQMVFAIESHLMANRGTNSFDQYKAAVEKLAMATLAYQLASDEVKIELCALFSLVAEHIQRTEPAPEVQARYAKTLLGVRSAKAIEKWATDNREFLLSLVSNEDWLAAVWNLFEDQLDDRFFKKVEPKPVGIKLAKFWLGGHPYEKLFQIAANEDATKPWGSQRRRLTDDDIMEFCENTLGFHCSLIMAAVAQFIFGENPMQVGGAEALTLFQKALKYGLPGWLQISCVELGFADRVLAQRLCEAVQGDGYTGGFFEGALNPHRGIIKATLADYPTYFKSVLASHI